MSAILSAVMGLLKAGDHIVCSAGVFGATVQLLGNIMKRFGVETTFVPGTEAAGFAATVTPRTRMIYLETPSNPLTEVYDIAALAAVAKKAGALLEHGYRRVGETRVDVARLLLSEPGRRLRGRCEDEARREIERFGMLAELAALDAGAHRERFELILVRHRSLQKAKNPFSAFAKNGFALALAVFFAGGPAAPAS
jgi:hypothetical protein